MNRHPLAKVALLLILALLPALPALAELTRTYVREDYPQLSDAEYANFRVVATTGMGKNALYRSSSPINPKLGRNTQADAAVKAAGIRTAVNLADSRREMRRRKGFKGSYYSELRILSRRLSVDFTSKNYREGLAEGLRFIAAQRGPYLIHCTEGKDRTGFAVAVLECLMGASADEVIEDYMLSFYNYYGVLPGSRDYENILRDNLASDLTKAFGLKSIRAEDADLASRAESYLLEIGMTQGEIQALKAHLSQDNP